MTNSPGGLRSVSRHWPGGGYGANAFAQERGRRSFLLSECEGGKGMSVDMLSRRRAAHVRGHAMCARFSTVPMPYMPDEPGQGGGRLSSSRNGQDQWHPGPPDYDPQGWPHGQTQGGGPAVACLPLGRPPRHGCHWDDRRGATTSHRAALPTSEAAARDATAGRPPPAPMKERAADGTAPIVEPYLRMRRGRAST